MKSSPKSTEEYTIDINKTSSMADETVRGFQQVIEADTKANFLNHLVIYQTEKALDISLLGPYLVGILFIDIVLNSNRAVFGKVFWRDLDQIGDGCLQE